MLDNYIEDLMYNIIEYWSGYFEFTNGWKNAKQYTSNTQKIRDIIEKRKPLANTARRAGWIGCNILFNRIPNEGRIYIVKNEQELSKEQVIRKVQKTDFIREYKIDARGWILDILSCVNQIEDSVFTLEQMYQFEDMLSIKHPENHNVKDKIRQQLQMLRDNGLIEFLGRGHYRKI